MMLAADIAAVPGQGLLRKCNGKPSKKGTGFGQRSRLQCLLVRLRPAGQI
jgi:hypothetical protein